MGNQCTTECAQNKLSSDHDERNVLVVYAHHDDHSFVGCVRDIVLDTLRARGFHLFQSSLYQMKFNPILNLKEFMVELEENNENEIALNGFQALPNFHIPHDVKEEIQKVMAAHYVVFIFPLWWESCPAILKGWFDRVLMAGILQDGGSFQGRERLMGKKSVLVVPTNPPPAYSPPINEEELNRQNSNLEKVKGRKYSHQISTGYSTPTKPKRKTTLIPRSFDERLKHITHGTLAFAGFDVLNLLTNATIQQIDKDGVKQDYLDEVHKYFQELEDQEYYVRAVDVPFD